MNATTETGHTYRPCSIPGYTWCKKVETKVESSRVDFGFSDDRGRRLGTTRYVAKVEWLPYDGAPAFCSSVCPVEKIGTVEFKAYTHATRNGETFGAIPRSVYVPSLAEAQKQADRRVAQCRARYAKQYA